MRIFFLLILLCSFFFSNSQSKKRISDSSNYFDQIQKDVVTFKANVCLDCNAFPFSNIKIIDKRYDTSAFGYLIFYKNIRNNCKLVTAKGFAADFEAFLNTRFGNNFNSSDTSLTIVLKKFWFYADYDFGNPGFLQNGKRSSDYFFQLRMDCFLYANNTYIPLVREDTTIAINGKFKDSQKGNILCEIFANILNNVWLGKLTLTPANTKRLNEQQFNEYYDNNFNQPILTDTVLKKGVYMSFDEFKKNAPSVANFEVRKMKLVDAIYIITGKDTILTSNAWGYCDGGKTYIKVDLNLFELDMQGRTFSFMGSKKLTHLQNGPGTYSYDNGSTPAENFAVAGVTSLLLSRDKFKVELVPIQLDMETGKVY